MTFAASAIWLGLAWFTAVNIAATLVVGGGVAILARRGLSRQAPARLLALRLAPGLVAALFTTLVFLPVHWVFEPADADEQVGWILRGLALLAVFLCARSIWRATAALRRSVRIQSLAATTFVQNGREIYGSPVLHGISLAGVVRTRVMVGAAARACLSDAELDAAIAHERAHERSRDNLKRFAMFCAPDILGLTAAGRRLEAAWRAAAEREADVRAVAGSPARATDLASALIKVARLGQGADGRPLSPVWSAFHEPPLLEARVKSLLAVPAIPGARRRSRAAVGPLVVALPLTWLAGYWLHLVTEALVRWLP
jgi:beta-lactamase regulating signal transducer with metallopeptidase domain